MPFTPAPTIGDDILTDTAGDDTVDALAGNDQITVTGGFDTVNGGADRDRLIINYSSAFQRVFMDGPLTGSLAAGYSGRLTVGFNNFRVDFSGIEDFTITGSAFNDALTVGDGDDVVNAGSGDDFVTFGAGNDSGDGGTGTDGFSTNLGSATSAIGINLVTNVSGSFTNFEYIGTLTTGSGNDTIVTRADLAIGETINTGAGADTITVARGYDGVAAGADRDRLIIDYSAATQSVRTENNALGGTLAGGYSGIIWHGNNGFRVDFTGIEDFTVTTGGSNDNVTTGDGDDVINLGGGDDFANFGAGNDSGDGGTGTDGFSANLGSDTLGVSINLVTGASSSFSNFEYLGALTTGSGNDTIVTRADVTAFETISTGAGADTITVARGFDNVAGGADRDRLIVNYTGATQGVSTDGTFSGSLGAGYTGRIGQGNTNYIVDFSGIEDFTVTTGGTNDNITTFDGDDIINLGGGDDFANFGAGNDSGDGGDGTDGFSANLSSATTAISINLVTGVSATFSNFEFLGTLTTGSGNDTIVTRNIIREEFINTGIGADTITVAGGFDRANGGADRDRLVIDYTGATQSVSTDGVFSGSLAAGYTGRIWQGNGNYTVDFSGIEDFTVTTGGTNDNIRVFEGDDVVNVGGGDDFVNFGAGNDSGDGGSGTDGFSANLGSATAGVSINLVTGVSATFSNFEYLGTLITGSGNDTIVTRADVLAGEAINAGAGADTITVARGFDNVAGGADRDRLIIDYTGATQNVSTDGTFSGSLGAGYTGRIWQGNANYTVDFSGIEDFTVTTGGTDDNIRVFDGDDVVNLGGGNDFVNFGAGNDSGDGGTGIDGFSANLGTTTSGVSINLVTGASATFANFEFLGTLTTGSGSDTIVTRGDVTAFETINTGAGADTITVARGFDTVAGGADRDRLIIDYTGATQNVSTDGTFSGSFAAGYTGRIGQGNTNYIVDFSGIEDFTVMTGGTDDTIRVFDGDDIIITGAGNDNVIGAGGNDLIDGGDGNDTLSGDAGIDTLSYASASAGVTVNLSTTTQQNTLGAGLDTISGFENVTGSTSADSLTGTSSANVIDGGAGDDVMTGGAGDDIYIVDADLDVVTEGVNAGIDEIRASARKVSMAANVENLTYIGTGNFSGRGNGLGNVITGGTNEDMLFGKGGDDTLIGGTGHDILDGGAGTDTIDAGDGNDIVYVGDSNDMVNGGAGTDTVIFYEANIVFAASQSSDVEVFENLSGGNLTAELNASDNVFGGNVGIDIVDGGAGNDLLYGREGDDQFIGGDGSDRLFGMADNDILSGGNDNDYLYGDTGNDQLSGGAADDVLYGEDGNDDLTGGSGIDLMGGGIGADDFIFAAGDSGSTFETADRIIDFSSAQGDRIDLSAIDSISGGGDDAFSFIGDTAFGNIAGQLRAETISGTTYVMGDDDGDGVADFVIKLDGTVPLSGSDFLL